MKHSLLVLFFLSLCLSFVFGQDSKITPKTSSRFAPIGAALVDENSDKVTGCIFETESRKNGYLKLYIENATEEDATGLAFRTNKVEIQGKKYNTRAVLERIFFSPRANTGATNFYKITEAKDDDGLTTYIVRQPNRDTTKGKNAKALAPGKQGNFVAKIEYEEKTENSEDKTERTSEWKIIPKGTLASIELWWLNGYRDFDVEPILSGEYVYKFKKLSETKNVNNIISKETDAPMNNNFKKIALKTANDVKNSTTINLKDLAIYTVDSNFLNDGKIYFTNKYNLQFVMDENTSVYIIPYIPDGFWALEDDKKTKIYKQYLGFTDGGGCFKNPNIVSGTKINDNNEFEWSLCTTQPSGVPWKRKDLKPGAFMIRGLKLMIGGGLGNVEEWEIGDKLYVGVKGDVLDSVEADELWHVITIVADE